MIVKNYIQFQKVLQWLDTQSEVSFDLETTGLNVRKDMVIGIALGNKTEAFYVVHQHLEANEYKSYINKQMLQQLWTKLKTKKLITWNGSFDVRFSIHYFEVDLSLNIFSEGQLARHTADENLDSWATLKAVAMSIFGTSVGQEKRDLDEAIIAAGGTPGQVWLGPLDLVGEYACQDAILTSKVEWHYRLLLTEQGMWNFYQFEEVMPLYREVTIQMENTGIKLDMPLLLKAQQDIAADIAHLDTQIRTMIKPHLEEFERWYLGKSIAPKTGGLFAQTAAKYYGIDGAKTKTGSISLSEKSLKDMPDCLFKRFIEGTERLPSHDVLQIQKMMRDAEGAFLLSSKDHWKRIFFDCLKETPLSFTPKKKEPQVDDDFLESIKTKYDFVPLLLDYNKLGKLKSTYMDRFIEESEGGRFYPEFHQHRTTTSRYSGDLQQLPRRRNEEEAQLSPTVLKYVNMIRSFFIADDGRVLVDADYNSLEVVIFADDAGDEPLLNMIRSKYDFYSQVAMDALDIGGFTADKKADNFFQKHHPEKRQDAKVYGLGIRYGMQAYKLAKTLDIGQSEAQRIIDRYFAKYPKLKTRMDEIILSAKTNGYVKSKSGSIRHLPKLKALHDSYGSVLDDGLKLWSKYNEQPEKYREMKYLARMYHGDINAALNFPIQNMAASIVNRASIAISRELRSQKLDAVICANVHDEILVSCADKDKDVVAAIVQDKMENTTRLSVPLVAKPVIALRYSEMKD